MSEARHSWEGDPLPLALPITCQLAHPEPRPGPPPSLSHLSQEKPLCAQWTKPPRPRLASLQRAGTTG